MDRIKRVYPLLVTLDDFGGTLLLTRLLNLYFDKFADRHACAVTAMPLFCTNIESLETVLAYADIYPLSGFLHYWMEADPRLTANLLAFTPEGLPGRRNELLYREWKTLSDGFKSRLFSSGGVWQG
jgi:hypothetical protein